MSVNLTCFPAWFAVDVDESLHLRSSASHPGRLLALRERDDVPVVRLVCAEPVSLSRPNQPWRPGGMQELPEGDESADPTACGAPLRGPRPGSSSLVARPGHGCMDVALKQNSILAVSPIW